jgi:predicted HicB family RNase H-like nuclease
MPKRETRERRVNLRLTKRLVSKVEAAAKVERRSLNSMFEVIVSDWAAKR